MTRDVELPDGTIVTIEINLKVEGADVPIPEQPGLTGRWTNVPNSFGIPVERSPSGKIYKIFGFAAGHVVQTLSRTGWYKEDIARLMETLNVKREVDTPYRDAHSPHEKYRRYTDFTLDHIEILTTVLRASSTKKV